MNTVHVYRNAPRTPTCSYIALQTIQPRPASCMELISRLANLSDRLVSSSNIFWSGVPPAVRVSDGPHICQDIQPSQGTSRLSLACSDHRWRRVLGTPVLGCSPILLCLFNCGFRGFPKSFLSGMDAPEGGLPVGITRIIGIGRPLSDGRSRYTKLSANELVLLTFLLQA
jgi:hypothetical protein